MKIKATIAITFFELYLQRAWLAPLQVYFGVVCACRARRSVIAIHLIVDLLLSGTSLKIIPKWLHCDQVGLTYYSRCSFSNSLLYKMGALQLHCRHHAYVLRPAILRYTQDSTVAPSMKIEALSNANLGRSRGRFNSVGGTRGLLKLFVTPLRKQLLCRSLHISQKLLCTRYVRFETQCAFASRSPMYDHIV